MITNVLNNCFEFSENLHTWLNISNTPPRLATSNANERCIVNAIEKAGKHFEIRNNLDTLLSGCISRVTF